MIEKQSSADLTEFRQKVLRKIQAQLSQPVCVKLVKYLGDALQAGADASALAAVLCRPSDTLFEALLASAKACFDVLEEAEEEKSPLIVALEYMLNWLLLLTVDDRWIKQMGDAPQVVIPMKTRIGVEIVASRIQASTCGFEHGKRGHDLIGTGMLLDGADIRWHTPGAINEIKRRLWRFIRQELPPRRFTEAHDNQLNTSIGARKITQDKHYLSIPLLSGDYPLKGEDSYALLKAQLPNLTIMFVGEGGSEGVFVLDERALMAWVSEIFGYIRGQDEQFLDNPQDQVSDKGKRIEALATLRGLVQDFWQGTGKDWIPWWVVEFLDRAEACEKQDVSSCFRVLQAFIAECSQSEERFPCGIVEETARFFVDLMSYYNSNIASVSAGPLYARLPSLECTQSAYQIRQDREALPLSLRQVAIADFQSIDRVQLFDLPADASWVVIVGENGDGKTSFLQAIALACTGDHGAQELFHQNTEINVELLAYGKDDESRCFRYFSWDENEKYSNTVSKKRRFKSLDRQLEKQQWHDDVADSQRKTQASIPHILGYSASRLEVQKERPDEGKNNPVHNLLKQSGRLEKFETWLQTQKLALDNSKYTDAQKTVMRRQSESARALLCALTLNNIEKIEIQGENVWYHEKGLPICWEHLSTGYKSMIAMIGDVLIRLFASQPTVDDPKELRGLVLIDEIETHLHPKWEIKLPSLLSECFPKVQFIGSCHSALPLLGLPAGAVILKASRDSHKRVQIQRLDIDLANLTPDLILTSPIFDLEWLLSAQNTDIADAHTQSCYKDMRESQRKTQKLVGLAPKMNRVFAQYLDEADD